MIVDEQGSLSSTVLVQLVSTRTSSVTPVVPQDGVLGPNRQARPSGVRVLAELLAGGFRVVHRLEPSKLFFSVIAQHFFGRLWA